MVWFLALFEAHALGELDHLAGPNAGGRGKALAGRGLRALSPRKLRHCGRGRWGVDGDALAGREGGDALDDLFGGLAGDGGGPQLGQWGWPTGLA